jgi:hypothetical protein
MAPWTVFEEQTVRISPRATSFTVVCDACARVVASDGYGAATVQGSLPLERREGSVTCERGHTLQVVRPPD